MNEIQDRHVAGEPRAMHRPVGLLPVADKRLARRGGEAALPRGGGQLSAQGMHVLPCRHDAAHEHLRPPAPRFAGRLIVRRVFLLRRGKTLDFPHHFPHPPLFLSPLGVARSYRDDLLPDE